MKVNSMLAVACTALVITSCSNEEIVPVSMSKKVSVVLNLPAMAHTRAIDNIANSGDMVTMSGTVKLYAKTAQDGGVVNTLTLQVSDLQDWIQEQEVKRLRFPVQLLISK